MLAELVARALLKRCSVCMLQAMEMRSTACAWTRNVMLKLTLRWRKQAQHVFIYTRRSEDIPAKLSLKLYGKLHYFIPGSLRKHRKSNEKVDKCTECRWEGPTSPEDRRESASHHLYIYFIILINGTLQESAPRLQNDTQQPETLKLQSQENNNAEGLRFKRFRYTLEDLRTFLQNFH